MSLLGMPPRIPCQRQVYRMHPDLYDPSDATGHPVLVISVDKALRTAEIVTRTTTIRARGRNYVVHPPQADLRLGMTGWWRIQWPHTVPFQAFVDPDAELCGLLEERTWEKVLAALANEGRES